MWGRSPPPSPPALGMPSVGALPWAWDHGDASLHSPHKLGHDCAIAAPPECVHPCHTQLLVFCYKGSRPAGRPAGRPPPRMLRQQARAENRRPGNDRQPPWRPTAGGQFFGGQSRQPERPHSVFSLAASQVASQRHSACTKAHLGALPPLYPDSLSPPEPTSEWETKLRRIQA